MLSPETLEAYRRMTPGERLALAFRLTDEATPYLFFGTPEQVRRKFELLRRQNDERNSAYWQASLGRSVEKAVAEQIDD